MERCCRRLEDLEESEKAAREALVELEREVLSLSAKHEKDKTKSMRRILPIEERIKHSHTKIIPVSVPQLH